MQFCVLTECKILSIYCFTLLFSDNISAPTILLHYTQAFRRAKQLPKYRLRQQYKHILLFYYKYQLFWPDVTEGTDNEKSLSCASNVLRICCIRSSALLKFKQDLFLSKYFYDSPDVLLGPCAKQSCDKRSRAQHTWHKHAFHLNFPNQLNIAILNNIQTPNNLI